MKKTLYFLALVLLLGNTSFSQELVGEKVDCAPIVQATTAELMQHWANYYPPGFIKRRNYDLGLEEPNRENLPQAPGTLELSQWPPLEGVNEDSLNQLDAPQTIGITFTGATLSDAGAFPPDVMGDVGPTQYVVFVNGRLRTFNKSTGLADGVIDADPDVFFNSVMTPPGAGEITYTSDPNVRYDRLSGRWFLTIIDVTLSGGSISRPNRILIAMSDGGIISGSTLWFFTWFQNSAGDFADYPSLGIDAQALYIGTDQFTLAGSFINTNAYIVDKASLISGTPTASVFTNLLNGSVGPFAPRGVDNFDPNNTGPTSTGYFIGVDNYSFGVLSLLRITDPVGTPSGTIISVPTTATTSFPVKVPHLGNTGGNNGRLDALDDRLYAAHLRNGRLWTAHNIGVNNTGTTTGTRTRNAARWYEIQNLNTTPSVFQVGTLYDNTTPNNTAQRNYWIPTIMVSGQGHAALGCSIAGTNERINCFTTGRLVGDALGTLRDGPGGTTFPGYTTSSTAYNPPGDPGGNAGRRWGDYSFTSLDPNDDMTMWTIQEFCSSTNIWGVRIAQLLAPPPVTPTLCTPSAVAPDELAQDIVVTGPSVSGSGFYDPGPSFPNYISALITGGIEVNSITYDSPTQVTININTSGTVNGFYDITITNPDGQSATGVGILEIDEALPVELSSFTAKVLRNGGVRLDWRTETEIDNEGFEILRSAQNDSSWILLGFMEGHGNSNSPKEYSFTDENVQYGSYAYRLKQIDTDGSYEYSNIVEVDAGSIPGGFVLEQNYPNPFNPATTIKFAVAETQKAELKVFDILGNEIETLFNGIAEGGKVYETKFDAANLPSGIYFYRLETKNKVANKKMLLIK